MVVERQNLPLNFIDSQIVFDADDPNSFYQLGSISSSENLKDSPLLFGNADINKEEDIVCLEKYFIEEDDRLDSQ